MGGDQTLNHAIALRKSSGKWHVRGSACVPHAGERVLAIANFFLTASQAFPPSKTRKRSFRRDAETNTRDACATHQGERDFASNQPSASFKSASAAPSIGSL